MTNPSAAALRQLGPETWGDRLARARHTTPGPKITLERAAEWLGRVSGFPIDPVTVSRWEKYETLPRDAGVRRKTAILCRLYVIDPSELDLTPSDEPDDLILRRIADTATGTSGYSSRRLRRMTPARAPHFKLVTSADLTAA